MTAPKPPTSQAVSALLRKAGFHRALNGFALRESDAGFVILAHVGPVGSITVEHVAYRGHAGGGHLAELNRYVAALSARYSCEISGTNSIVVTAAPSPSGEGQ